MNHSSKFEEKDYFIQQLVFIDENIQDLTNLYYASTPIQDRIKHFFSIYVIEVEDLVKQNRKSKFFKVFPKVFIGTKVTVLYDDDHETEDYVICFPEQSDPDEGFISFLSPVGRQLLLKKLGDKIPLRIPTGEMQVTIKDISYAGNIYESEERVKEA